MTTAAANAFPRKHFFMEMFTRDISFEDCVLDLIDNSIDSLVRDENIDPARQILLRQNRPAPSKGNLPSIHLTLNAREVIIRDTCGGIPPELVMNEVFTFGHDPGAVLHQQLGIYGVGLKRAIFKMAERFEMESRSVRGGFRAFLDIEQWAEKDETKDDWKVPIEYIPAAKSEREAGTQIRFSPLREEVKMRLRDGALMGKLTHAIAQTYSLFLEDYVHVFINDQVIEPDEIPIGAANDIKPGQADFTKGEVKVRIICGLAARRPQWTHERAGWYILCNGRVVVAADKTELTGWGEPGLPSFHSKYKGFVGVVIFRSRDPLALPWTTTKRGLNRESPVYHDAKREMVFLARPIISFLNSMYPSDLVAEEPQEREIAGRVAQADLRQLAAQPAAPFVITTPSTAEVKTTKKIQYEAPVKDIERVKRAIRKPKWSANKVGKYTFQHFVRTECPE